MIKIWIKHKIVETCIDLLFEGLFKNFVLPKKTPTFSIIYNKNVVYINDGKRTMEQEIVDKNSASHDFYPREISYAVLKFIDRYYKKINVSSINLIMKCEK